MKDAHECLSSEGNFHFNSVSSVGISLSLICPNPCRTLPTFFNVFERSNFLLIYKIYILVILIQSRLWFVFAHVSNYSERKMDCKSQ